MSTPNERYHQRLEALGIPHQHNRRNPLHKMHFVSRDLEDVFCFVKLNLRINKPLKMLLVFWRLHNEAVEEFEAAKTRTPEQKKNFKYYVTDSREMIIQNLIKRIGGIGDTIRELDKYPLADLDSSLRSEIERVAALPLKVR